MKGINKGCDLLNIRINVKQLGSRWDKVADQPFHIERTPETLRELIRECVHSCVQIYNNLLDSNGNPNPLSDKAVDDMADVGKIAFGINYNGKSAEPNTAFQNAITCYEDGFFRVFLDGEELTELDAPITITENSTLTFVRLTMLAGQSFLGGPL